MQVPYNASKAAAIHMYHSRWNGSASRVLILYRRDTSRRKSLTSSLRTLGRYEGGREGEVSELKGAYLYLASDAVLFMTGAEITIDGGTARHDRKNRAAGTTGEMSARGGDEDYRIITRPG
ncbi:hypothetical protein F4779DRAFT_615788 [Xylariaceae sp. FL0662B]|nr:hypothetical protein F4779DRAFT_615788 [Xylariaceae sp. FL0662B]